MMCADKANTLTLVLIPPIRGSKTTGFVLKEIADHMNANTNEITVWELI